MLCTPEAASLLSCSEATWPPRIPPPLSLPLSLTANGKAVTSSTWRKGDAGQSRGTAPASGLQTAGEWPRARPLSPSRPPPPIPSRLPSLVPCPHLRHSMPCPAHRTSSPRASRNHPSPSPTGSPEERRARGPGPWLPPACSREGGGCAEVRHGDETALGAIGAMTWGGGRGQREGITP